MSLLRRRVIVLVNEATHQGVAYRKEVAMERAKITTEVKEGVKEATPEVVEKLIPKKSPLVSLRETLCSEGFDEKRGWRRIVALWGSTNSPFCR
jgi:hypothetical protein